MKSSPEVITALNNALKYEHTIIACQLGYQKYYKRWGFHELWLDFKHFREESECRRNQLVQRIFRLEGMPTAEHYEFELETLDVAADVEKEIDYFLNMFMEARQVYENGRETCKESGDSVSHKLMGRNKEGIEYQLVKFESKQKRVSLIGPELYLAEHMHVLPFVKKAKGKKK